MEKKTYGVYWVGGYVNGQYDSDVLEARSLKEAMYVFCRDRQIPIDRNVLGLEAYNLLTDEKLATVQHTDLEQW